MARSEPIAEDSLPDMRARRRPGTAMAAMMPMIATTISSSISVNPFWLRTFMTSTPQNSLAACPLESVGSTGQQPSGRRDLVSNGSATAVVETTKRDNWLALWNLAGVLGRKAAARYLPIFGPLTIPVNLSGRFLALLHVIARRTF